MQSARQGIAESTRPGPVPSRGGVGLKSRHFAEIVETRPDIGFFEVHTENYMGAGGPPHRWLEAIRKDYALSMHGVGLSLGSATSPDEDHLRRTKALVDRYQPGLVSEHLSWSGVDGTYLNDLVPLPYTEESLDIVCWNVDRVQEAVGRRILVENPSSYLAFAESVIPETEFLAAVARRTGCGILLDVNNVYVSARNHDFDPVGYLVDVPHDLVGEIHLAGHVLTEWEGVELRIDDHGSRVCKEVWGLYRLAMALCGRVPTLIEWDTDVPPLSVLLDEAAKAEAIMDKHAGSEETLYVAAA